MFNNNNNTKQPADDRGKPDNTNQCWGVWFGESTKSSWSDAS